MTLSHFYSLFLFFSQSDPYLAHPPPRALTLSPTPLLLPRGGPSRLPTVFLRLLPRPYPRPLPGSSESSGDVPGEPTAPREGPDRGGGGSGPGSRDSGVGPAPSAPTRESPAPAPCPTLGPTPASCPPWCRLRVRRPSPPRPPPRAPRPDACLSDCRPACPTAGAPWEWWYQRIGGVRGRRELGSERQEQRRRRRYRCVSPPALGARPPTSGAGIADGHRGRARGAPAPRRPCAATKSNRGGNRNPATGRVGLRRVTKVEPEAGPRHRSQGGELQTVAVRVLTKSNRQ